MGIALGLGTILLEVRALNFATTGFKGLSRQLAMASAQISSVGLAATGAIAGPIMGIGVASARAATAFDKDMRNIQSISRISEKELQVLSKQFLNLSTDITKTVDTPEKLAEAFYEIQSAGFVGAAGMAVLERATKTATAGLSDTKEVSIALTNALNSYGVNVDNVSEVTREAARWTDIMMLAVDRGVFHFSDLTQQMGDFINTAGALNIKPEEIFAALTTLTKKGVNIDLASTSLNRVLLQFLRPSPKAAAAARQLGVDLSSETVDAFGLYGSLKLISEKLKLSTFFEKVERDSRVAEVESLIKDAENELRRRTAAGESTADIKKQIADLKEAKKLARDTVFEAMDPTKMQESIAENARVSKDAIAALFPDIRSLRAIYALTNDDLAMYEKDLEGFMKAPGTVNNVYERQTKSFDAQLQTFKNNIIVAAITLGNALMPRIIEATKALIPLIKAFADLGEAQKTNIINTAMKVAFVGPTFLMLGLLVNTIATVVELFTAGGELIGKVFSGIATALMSTFGMTLPAVLAVLAVFVIAWNQNWFNIRNTVLDAIEGNGGILPTIEKMMSKIQEYSVVLGAFKTLFGGDKFTKAEGLVDQAKLAKMMQEKDKAFMSGLPPAVKTIATAFSRYAQRDVDQQIANAEYQLDRLKEVGRKYINTYNEVAKYSSSGDVPKKLRDDLTWYKNEAIEIFGTSDVNRIAERIGVVLSDGMSGGVKDAFGNTDSAIKSEIDNMFPEVLGSFGKIGEAGINALLLGIEKKMPSVANAIRIMFGMIRSVQLAADGLSMGPQRPFWGQIDPFTGKSTGAKPPSYLDEWNSSLSTATKEIENAIAAATGNGMSDGIDSGAEYFDKAMKGSASKLQTALESALKSAFDKGISKAKELYDIFDGGGDPITDPNGPYQKIYRVLDIAKNWKDSPGADTEKWVREFGMIDRPREEVVAWAQAISRNFQMGPGLWNEDVSSLIDWGALVKTTATQNLGTNTVHPAAIAALKAAAESQGLDTSSMSEILKAVGLGEEVSVDDLSTAMAPTIANMRTALVEQMQAVPADNTLMTKMLGDQAMIDSIPIVPNTMNTISKQIGENETSIKAGGARFFRCIEAGFLEAAESSGFLQKAVDKAVANTLRGGEME